VKTHCVSFPLLPPASYPDIYKNFHSPSPGCPVRKQEELHLELNKAMSCPSPGIWDIVDYVDKIMLQCPAVKISLIY
jgi:hypothetical protein